MDQPTQSRRTQTLDRPIHRACVVPGCPCGSTAASSSATRRSLLASPRVRRRDVAPALVIDPAWHSVGLPVA